MSRLEQLLRFAQEEPGDAFNIYAVAMEYLKLDSSKPIPFFETLLKEHPDYIATYYTYGKLLQHEKDFPKARDVFERGIEKAAAVQNAKVIGELKSAMSELEFEMDE